MTALAHLDALMDEAQACRVLAVCGRTLRKERQAGRLPYIMIGRAIRYSAADLQAYIERARLCPSTAGKDRRSGNTTSRSTVSDFAEALARRERGKRSR